jgi:hypothetical protein
MFGSRPHVCSKTMMDDIKSYADCAKKNEQDVIVDLVIIASLLHHMMSRMLGGKKGISESCASGRNFKLKLVIRK